MASRAATSSLMLHCSILIFMIYHLSGPFTSTHTHTSGSSVPVSCPRPINLHPWNPVFPLHTACLLSFPASPICQSVSSPKQKTDALLIRCQHPEPDIPEPNQLHPFVVLLFPFAGFRLSFTRDHYGEEPNLLGQAFYPWSSSAYIREGAEVWVRVWVYVWLLFFY